ncbi:FecR family protein [Aliarcobacter vitoriensis]|uniref:FecR family protein n=1 Tax=Aliarcobacter vitoriensis TaxID=2011099 RepID=UPI003AAB0384
MKSVDEQAISWLIKEKEGLTQNEEEQLKHWLESNPSHKKSYNTNKLLRQRFSKLSNNTIEKLVENANKGAKRTKFIQRTKKFMIAASVFLCIGFGTDYYFVPVYSQNFVSAQELQNTITLPDDSKIVLDVNSNLNVDYYKSSRKIDFVDGRAIFYVAKDKEKPFIIKTKDAEIEVVGTTFEVSNINNSFSVKVKEGTVKVTSNRKYTYLNQGDKIEINEDKKMDFEKVEVENIASWENGFLVFNKTTLKDSLAEFSRYKDLKIEFQDERVAKIQITGKFAINDFDKFLVSLPKIYSIKVDKKENIFKFSKK